ncbi:MerR family transcriptional regulator [Metabacillus sp. GX 13764]|uniref:MerR family transcriptional regulator n=1 Tax=Metabacillus kandeliae TaxID=2900151 RepID=UPI001E47D9CA|nr:MerR family transcriptional regulator [Metabacillus kandeliae]MCD7036442.1 MerR family transcriptional regulator [Metabacillus kandeliae]
MKIHQLAERTGLTAPTIRFYEKEGLLDGHFVQRLQNNYRDYSDQAVEYLLFIKKLQSVGFSLAELKEILHEDDTNALTILRVVELLTQKIEGIKRKRDEFEQILETLNRMLENKIALMNDPQKANSLFNLR